ncbi:hypothetical protein AN189_01100 [Loktanella sp. 3ANDIMAR09]|uniref:hypothetical protein n=1 Tax=Loktanella sp. 3ANDIMAR09 TaxID=1225657 RepID=UPI0006FB27BC|nr:hypothetical protein [Loktanella sp. 3ANDIMAR09]KQI70027.1 hypothetical protein AN189_01100 [Loktanella sp. 3ANDIMAR09]
MVFSLDGRAGVQAPRPQAVAPMSFLRVKNEENGLPDPPNRSFSDAVGTKKKRDPFIVIP